MVDVAIAIQGATTMHDINLTNHTFEINRVIKVLCNRFDIEGVNNNLFMSLSRLAFVSKDSGSCPWEN